MNVANDLIAGIIGGAAATLIEYPFDTVKVLMQAGRYDSYIACGRGIVTQGPLLGFYRGMSARLIASGFEHAVVFASYKWTIRACGGDENRPTLVQVAIGGCGSGIASMLCLTPFELVKCRMQADGPASTEERLRGGGAAPRNANKVKWSANGGRRYRSSWDCARQAYKHGGIRELYKGGVATLYREVPGTAAWCGTYDLLKTYMAAPGENPKDLPMCRLMLAGGCSGVAFWTVVFPADAVKTRMQVDANFTDLSFLQAVRVQLKEAGLRGLYKGWALTAARSFPSNAVVFMCYDVVSRSMARWEKKREFDVSMVRATATTGP